MSVTKSISDPEGRVRQLSKQAATLSEVDISIPLVRYFRAAKEVARTAQYYEKEHSLENAFVLYSKYITLFVEKFPQHPQYKNLSSAVKQENVKSLNNVFSKAESVKKQLIKVYSLEFKEVKEKDVQKSKEIIKDAKSKNKDTKDEELKELEERFQLLKQQEQQNLKDKVSVGAAKTSKADANINTSAPPPTYASAICDGVYPQLKFETDPSNIQNNRPTFDRSLKPSNKNIHEDDGLKTVHIPSNLAQEFLNRVQLNTDNNIETCGILCGRLQQNEWHVTHIIIPNQIGKADSCDLENDEEVVEYQDVHDLVTLGWIHTHPSQTAFLSSVDQHTHWPYQKLLPEAISIVCAPKFKETGYFNLTPEFGMNFLQNCRGQGFHEHPIKPAIFQTAPHIHLESFSKVLVGDLRRNRK